MSRVPLPPAPVRSCQRVALARPVVDESPDGARMLGDRYWHAVERATGGMVRRVPTAHGGCALRLRPGGPPLLSFATPRLAVEAGCVRCSYPILGGVLAQSAGGALAFEQQRGATLERVDEVAHHLAAAQGVNERGAVRRVELGASDFHVRDVAIADAVASAAEAVGAAQIVYLGGLGDDGDDLSEHLRSRREVGIRLAARTTPVTTLRSAIVIGRGSAAFVTITALVDRLPGMICPRWVSTPTQPVALADIARVLVGVAGCSEALGQTYDVGGPEVMTYREMLERVARLRGRRLVIVEVPVLTPRLSSLWITLVTPVHASVARPLVEGLRNRTVAADDRIRELVPFEPTPFDVAARDALN